MNADVFPLGQLAVCASLQEALWGILWIHGIPIRIIDLITTLNSGMESAVKCRGHFSGFLSVNSGVRQRCILAPKLFNTFTDWILGKATDLSHCRASIGNIRITFCGLLEVLVMDLKVLYEEVKSPGLKFS